MNSHNLIYILTAVLFPKMTFCSKTEDISCTDDATMGLILIENLPEQNEMFEKKDSIVDKKIIKEDSFESFFDIMKSARKMFKKVEEEKERIVTLNRNLLHFSSVLKMETLIDLKSINRDRYLAYLKESIGSINKFLPLFKKKIDDENGMNISKLIKEGVLELEKAKASIPKIFDTEQTERKFSDFENIKKTFKNFEKQLLKLKQESERYYKSVIDFFEYYKSSDTKPEKIKAHLVKLRNNSLFIKKNELRIKAVSCNQFVAVFFRNFTTSCGIEIRLLNSLCEILDDIWVCKGKVKRFLQLNNNVPDENKKQ